MDYVFLAVFPKNFNCDKCRREPAAIADYVFHTLFLTLYSYR